MEMWQISKLCHMMSQCQMKMCKRQISVKKIINQFICNKLRKVPFDQANKIFQELTLLHWVEFKYIASLGSRQKMDWTEIDYTNIDKHCFNATWNSFQRSVKHLIWKISSNKNMC